MDFWRVAELLNRRKWLILLSMVMTAALTFGATRLVGTKWMASMRLAAVPTSDLSDPSQQSTSEDPIRQEKTTQLQAGIYFGLLRSKEVLKPSLEKIGENDLSPQRIKSLNLIAVGANSFELQVQDSNPRIAEILANELGKNLVKKSSTIYSSQAEEVVRLLREQMQKMDAGLEQARKRYDNRRKQLNVLGRQSDDVSLAIAQLNTARQKREDESQKLAEIEARLRFSQQQMAQIPPKIKEEHPATPNPTITALEQQLAQMESQLTVLRSKYTDEKIEVKQVLASRDALAARLHAERVKSLKAPELIPNPAYQQQKLQVAQLKQQLQGSKAQINAINATIKKSNAEIEQAVNGDNALQKLATDIAQKSEARSSLLARLQNARMALDVARGKNPLTVVSWVSDFNPPINTRSGRTKKLLILAVLCAFLGTSGLAIAFDSIDRRVKTVREADLALPVPVCAAIPQAVGDIAPKALSRVAEYQPFSIHAESYHFLALRLLSNQSEHIRSIMAITTKIGQGSTNTLANLAIVLAQAGKRVVLVDANIRKPAMHEIFQLPNDYGFTNLLEEEVALGRGLQSTSEPNLFIITSGPPPSNPWKMFRSQRLLDFSSQLQNVADYVLYDTPSAVAFADALNLTPIVDAALLCVRALEPLSGTEGQLVDTLKEAHITVIGSVLTDVPAPLLEGYNNYQQYRSKNARSLPAALDLKDNADIAIRSDVKNLAAQDEQSERKTVGTDSKNII
jgi:capsular exopolysaccharide synthesis family protein